MTQAELMATTKVITAHATGPPLPLLAEPMDVPVLCGGASDGPDVRAEACKHNAVLLPMRQQKGLMTVLRSLFLCDPLDVLRLLKGHEDARVGIKRPTLPFPSFHFLVVPLPLNVATPAAALSPTKKEHC